ncbi:Tetracycline resistance protein [Gracilaria domingensis]|nr:Tetracycline resistance protein [Gracilaria domingensis]
MTPDIETDADKRGQRCSSNAEETTILLSPDGDQVLSHEQHANPLPYLLVAVFLFLTCIAMTVPVRPRLILDAAGQDASLASYFTGTVDSIQAVITIFSSPLFGAISDVIGRKPVIMITHLGELIGLAFVAQFPTSLAVQGPAYTLIALTNAYFSTANTYIADISTDPLITSRNYGWLGATSGLAFFIGPTIGGLTESTFYLASSFHLACVGIVCSLLFVWFYLPETKPSESGHTSFGDVVSAIRNADINPLPRVRRLLAHSESLQWISLTLATMGVAQSGLNSVLFLYASVKLGWESKDTGIFLSLVGLSLLISQSILAPLAVKALGESRTIVIGYSLVAVHFFMYGAARTTFGMYMALVVGTLGFVSDPAMKSLIARQVDRSEQGGLQGSLSALSAVVKPFSPLVSNALLAYGTSIGIPGLPFFAIGMVAAVATGFAQVTVLKSGLK